MTPPPPFRFLSHFSQTPWPYRSKALHKFVQGHKSRPQIILITSLSTNPVVFFPFSTLRYRISIFENPNPKNETSNRHWSFKSVACMAIHFSSVSQTLPLFPFSQFDFKALIERSYQKGKILTRQIFSFVSSNQSKPKTLAGFIIHIRYPAVKYNDLWVLGFWLVVSYAETAGLSLLSSQVNP